MTLSLYWLKIIPNLTRTTTEAHVFVLSLKMQDMSIR